MIEQAAVVTAVMEASDGHVTEATPCSAPVITWQTDSGMEQRGDGGWPGVCTRGGSSDPHLWPPQRALQQAGVFPPSRRKPPTRVVRATMVLRQGSVDHGRGPLPPPPGPFVCNPCMRHVAFMSAASSPEGKQLAVQTPLSSPVVGDLRGTQGRVQREYSAADFIDRRSPESA